MPLVVIVITGGIFHLMGNYSISYQINPPQAQNPALQDSFLLE